MTVDSISRTGADPPSPQELRTEHQWVDTPTTENSSPSFTNLTAFASDKDGVGNEGVAIVGMACRTAGKINSPEKLWEFVLEKKDASGEIPAWRWEPWLRRDARNAKEIEKTINKGYFIEDLENFDASFFGISPKEAEQMDPHQRLGLELSWEALENAGLDPKSLAGSDTAVFMGVDTDDYSRLLLEDLPNVEPWMGIGTAPHGVPSRISYHLDLMGPSTAVDAACASSLVAVHLGRQAILNRESEVAIVGGVHVLLAPALTRMLEKSGALCPDGICRSFDDAANGYARGEGGAVIILKRLSKAILDGDNILATLQGSAIAQDGRTNGIMAPNAKAQELVGRLALSRSGIDPLSVGYVEAHATSTPLGDPTELSAISALYGTGAGRTTGNPVSVGSIKPNVGHLEAAAGAIGLVKAVLSVNKGELAPQARLNKLNTRVDWDNSGLHIVREASRWVSTSGPRRAAICSYGYGGTVSHAIIEEYSKGTLESPGHATAIEPIILTLSATQEKRLPGQAGLLASWLRSSEAEGWSLTAIANTLAQRRAHHDYRAALVVTNHESAIEALETLASSQPPAGFTIAQGRVQGPTVPSVWVFSGHGAQWSDMGRDLVKSPVFVASISELDILIKREAGFSVLEVLRTGDFETSERVQIVTYVVQIGLSQVLQSKGVVPRAIIGHSVGEIAASVVAGCLTPKEGASLVTRRALLYAKIREEMPGAMSLVCRSFQETQKELEDRQGLVAAIDSSPSSCVISGAAEAVSDYVAELHSRGVQSFRVKTDVAFHSPILEQLVEPFTTVMQDDIKPCAAKIPLYSTSHTDPRTECLRDIGYWANNMTKTVLLRSAVAAAVEDGYRVFVEVSSHPIVLRSVNETVIDCGVDDSNLATISTMQNGTPALESIQYAIAKLYVQGVSIDFGAQFGHRRPWCPSVPGTQWVHHPYYKQVETGPVGGNAIHEVDKHTLLGQRTAIGGTNTVLYTTKLNNENNPFPGTHPLDGTEIIPAAVYINTFHHATAASIVSDVQLRVPGDTISVVSAADSKSDTGDDAKNWVSHSSCTWGELGAADLESIENIVDIAAIKFRIGTILSNNFSVNHLRKCGVEGMAFPWQVTEHYGNDKEMLAKVDLDPDVPGLLWDGQSWAPMLDAATSIGATMFSSDSTLRIVSKIDRVILVPEQSLPKVAYLYVEEAADSKGLAVHATAISEEGKVLAKLQAMQLSEVGGLSIVNSGVEGLVHQIEWIPPSFAEKPRPLNNVLLVSADTGLLDIHAKQLRGKTNKLFSVGGLEELGDGIRPEILEALRQNGSTVVYLPGFVSAVEDVASAAEDFVWKTASIVRFLEDNSIAETCKLFVLTDRVYEGRSATSLAHGTLHGLARIVAAEHPELWGGLIDAETPEIFPTMAVKYVGGLDVIRVTDGLPRRPIMRPLPPERRLKFGSDKTLLPKPEGTYVVTGGFGALGLETLSFLVEKGARRLVVVSRRGLPSRRRWESLMRSDTSLAFIVQQIRILEEAGATIWDIAIDISSNGAAGRLLDAIDALGLPPVLGVVHAAGVLEDALVKDMSRSSLSRVLAPKISGALSLHEAFPPKSVDFFVMYSSIGQLVGTAGQASYGSGNGFLDALATHRRLQGDNAVAFQFTAWRGLGMATTTDFLTVELQSKGITDISRAEAFQAWTHVDKFDVDNVAVTRCLPIEESSMTAIPILEGVVGTKPKSATAQPGAVRNEASALDHRPSDPQELEKWLDQKIRQCIADVLHMRSIEDIDSRTPVADLGVDSVMTVALRQKFESVLRIKVPLTLTWNHPTTKHLVAWFKDRLLRA